MDPQQQNVIFRKYGDSLYQKGEYDNAMQQYLKAIDNTEPSQVIRKVRVLSMSNTLTNDAFSSWTHSEYIT
jgi:Tfp pilus assembly protein PilF